ncbi:MAG: sensor histidine kinase, partial [Myxococcaceae bacterium]|nr:sensor histidine kinase [Myxococcaceae bacterium]
LASMGLLAAGVAHEINNPLAYVLNNIEIASREIGRDESSRNAQQALATALEGVFRIRTIVHDLVTLSRTEPDTTEAVDVAATLESTLALAQNELAGRVRIVRAYAPCPPAQANAARLGQVFLNLIVNAVDAMPKESSANELRLTTGSDDRGRAIVEVTDNGSGIAHELLGRIFDPFYTTKLAGKGTGLGLAISHEIVSELGGEISVESVLGEGTTFRVALLPSGAAA